MVPACESAPGAAAVGEEMVLLFHFLLDARHRLARSLIDFFDAPMASSSALYTRSCAALSCSARSSRPVSVSLAGVLDGVGATLPASVRGHIRCLKNREAARLSACTAPTMSRAYVAPP